MPSVRVYFNLIEINPKSVISIPYNQCKDIFILVLFVESIFHTLASRYMHIKGKACSTHYTGKNYKVETNSVSQENFPSVVNLEPRGLLHTVVPSPAKMTLASLERKKEKVSQYWLHLGLTIIPG